MSFQSSRLSRSRAASSSSMIGKTRAIEGAPLNLSAAIGKRRHPSRSRTNQKTKSRRKMSVTKQRSPPRIQKSSSRRNASLTDGSFGGSQIQRTNSRKKKQGVQRTSSRKKGQQTRPRQREYTLEDFELDARPAVKSPEPVMFRQKTVGRNKQKTLGRKLMNLDKRMKQSLVSDNVMFNTKNASLNRQIKLKIERDMKSAKQKKKEAIMKYRRATKDRAPQYNSASLASVSASVVTSTNTIHTVQFSGDLGSIDSFVSEEEGEVTQISNFDSLEKKKTQKKINLEDETLRSLPASISSKEKQQREEEERRESLRKQSVGEFSFRKKKFSSLTSSLRTKFQSVFSKDKFGRPTRNKRSTTQKENEQQITNFFLQRQAEEAEPVLPLVQPREIRKKKNRSLRKLKKRKYLSGMSTKVKAIFRKGSDSSEDSLLILEEFKGLPLSSLDMSEEITRSFRDDDADATPKKIKKNKLLFKDNYNSKGNRIRENLSVSFEHLNEEEHGHYLADRDSL
eukprot:snap_masked-scaffold_23-processed-gene-4.18-mRNA-1 protein AED:1.00 eAED:1.00 QI:0/-1/0/0/-1/1/1/0/509